VLPTRVLLALVLFTSNQAIAQAGNPSLAIDPPFPTASDSVSLIVSGTKARGPVSVLRDSIIVLREGGLTHVLAGITLGTTPGQTPYSFAILIGPLPVGSQLIRYDQFLFEAGQVTDDASSLEIQFNVGIPRPIPALSMRGAAILSVVLLCWGLWRCHNAMA
jgi:hypothetical protein